MLKYMLDTNIVLYTIKRRPIEVIHTFNRFAGQLCISSITAAELIYGAEKSARPEPNMSIVEDFVSRLELLNYGFAAAAHYAQIQATLERGGTPIGVNDCHIGAHARSEGLVLVTNNVREFDRIPGLRVENWVV